MAIFWKESWTGQDELFEDKYIVAWAYLPKRYEKGDDQMEFKLDIDKIINMTCESLEEKLRGKGMISMWIPCSERLPDMFEDVYTTAYVKAVGGTVDGEMLKIGAMGYINELNQWKLKSTIRGFDFNSHENIVIAWMPLPLPYEGDEDK